jgi:GH25 family lysozyme M1 (1,4-beta-N-acetylmuramidase)
MALQKIPDGSHWSQTPNIKETRPHVQGVIWKVSESNDWGPDSTYAPTAAQCVEEGMPYSGYHFARFDADPIEQADWFIQCMGAYQPHVVWWDAETVIAQALGLIKEGEHAPQMSAQKWTNATKQIQTILFTDAKLSPQEEHKLAAVSYLLSGQVLTDTLKWLRYMRDKGYEAGVYTSVGFAQAYLQGDASLAEFSLWIAHPYRAEPTIPEPWAQFGGWKVNPWVKIWQYSWVEVVPGFPELAVDMNYLSPLAAPAHEYFGNGAPYTDPSDPRLPDHLKVVTSWLNVRTGHGTNYTKAGEIRNPELCLKPFEKWTADNGEVWYRIGTGLWVAAYWNGQTLCKEVWVEGA